MQKRRTDLALEAGEAIDTLTGVSKVERVRDGFPITTVRITDHSGAMALGKPIGTYTTLELGKLVRRESDAFSLAAYALADELSELLDLAEHDSVLVVGLGNRAITPDAIGPETVRNILVTNHLIQHLHESFSHLRPVCVLEAGVLGTTGIESAQLTHAVAGSVRPDRVIVVDALASRRMSRVCSTVQLTDTGIIPGSGVGNSRLEISSETLGVPVIAVGVPTVVDAGTLAADIAEQIGVSDNDIAELERFGGMVVTPRNIDESVADISRLVGYAINFALHRELCIDDITMLLG